MGVKQGPLADHPNFRAPKAPRGRTVEEIVQYTLDFAANLVSPPKVDGEDEERECIDVAAQLRSAAADVLVALQE